MVLLQIYRHSRTKIESCSQTHFTSSASVSLRATRVNSFSTAPAPICTPYDNTQPLGITAPAPTTTPSQMMDWSIVTLLSITAPIQQQKQ